MDKLFVLLFVNSIILVSSLPIVDKWPENDLKKLIYDSTCNFPPRYLATEERFASQLDVCSKTQSKEVIHMCTALKAESQCSLTPFIPEMPTNNVTMNLFYGKDEEKPGHVTKLCKYMASSFSWTPEECNSTCSDANFLICDLYVAMDKVLRSLFENEIKDYTHIDYFVHSGTLKFLYPYPPVGSLHNSNLLESCLKPTEDSTIKNLCTVMAEAALKFVKDKVTIEFEEFLAVRNVTSTWDPCKGMTALDDIISSEKFKSLQENCAQLCKDHMGTCKMIYLGLEKYKEAAASKGSQRSDADSQNILSGKNEEIKVKDETITDAQSKQIEVTDGTGATSGQNTENGGQPNVNTGTGTTSAQQPGNGGQPNVNTGNGPTSGQQPDNGGQPNVNIGTGTTSGQQPGNGGQPNVNTGTGPNSGQQNENVEQTNVNIGTGPTSGQQNGNGEQTNVNTGTGPTSGQQNENGEQANVITGTGPTSGQQNGNGEQTNVNTGTGNQPEMDKGDMGHPSTDNEKTQNEEKNPQQKEVSVGEDDDDDGSHFMAYFLVFIVLSIAGYIIFHNKQKIIALVIEGKGAKGGRRPNTKDYKPVKAEDVMPSLEKSAYGKNYVF